MWLDLGTELELEFSRLQVPELSKGGWHINGEVFTRKTRTYGPRKTREEKLSRQRARMVIWREKNREKTRAYDRTFARRARLHGDSSVYNSRHKVERNAYQRLYRARKKAERVASVSTGRT